jgi:Domain of unknown function (DUF1902)
MERPMKIVVRAFWDDEADVWVAVADGKLGLVTEAATIDELTLKLPIMARDLLSSGVDDKINCMTPRRCSKNG